VENSISLVAAKEKWTTEHRGPVQELLQQATEDRRATAITDQTWEVRRIVPDAQEGAKEVRTTQ
jgi:hypothetical protein